jgi:farnesyl diphosphate synthase
MHEFSDWVIAIQGRTEAALQAHMPAVTLNPNRLHEAMRYCVLGGGKRVRALLAHAAGEFCQADPAHVDRAAMAVELIHAYSLVHDDMPCMDDDDLRRGKPACHKQYDDATALLVGDALQSLAFELLSDEAFMLNPQTRMQMIHILAHGGRASHRSCQRQSATHTIRTGTNAPLQNRRADSCGRFNGRVLRTIY